MFKVSRNGRSYKDLTPEFINTHSYEIDLTDDRKCLINQKRKFQIDEVNKTITNGPVLFYIVDKQKRIYKGIVKSKFMKNTSNPFYLSTNVKSKAKNKSIDISKHVFYTCKVDWCIDNLSEYNCEQIKKLYPKFLAKTIIRLK